MIVLLDICLLLAFASTIAVDILRRQPTGPEGPIGVWLLLLIPCLFVAVMLFVLAAKGLLDSVPGGHLIQCGAAVGVLLMFGIALFGTLDRQDGLVQGLLMIVPYLILVGCAAIIHHTYLPDSRLVHWGAALVFGGSAVAGWGLAGMGIFLYMKTDLERSAQQVQKEREQEDQNKQWEVAEHAKLDDSASLYSFLQFIWSRNDQVRHQAQEKVHRFPGLDGKLVELIDLDCDEAISYIAKLCDNPPAKFAPSWGRMLARQMKKWDTPQYDEHAGTWEQNLNPILWVRRRSSLPVDHFGMS